MKTPEEAAKEYASTHESKIQDRTDWEKIKSHFIAGAEWQASQPKPEQGMKELIRFVKLWHDYIDESGSKEDKYAKMAYKDVLDKAEEILPSHPETKEGEIEIK